MTDKLTQELDNRLRAFIKTPDNFLDGIALVNALHHYPVLASEAPYALDIEGQKVTPVFTDVADLEAFKAIQDSAREQNWIHRSSLEVLEEAIVKQLTGLVYNLKKTGDAANSTIFKSADMIQFINHYTGILNKIMGEKNLKADQLEKAYLVPAFVTQTGEKTSTRRFPTMTDPHGDSYLPVFSDLQSYAKWYNQEQFGGQFRQHKGATLAWTITDITEPVSGENYLNGAKGIVIDPFNDEMTLLPFEALK